MRTMQRPDHSDAEIIEHIILRNFWEIYVIEDMGDGSIFNLTIGMENEFGYTSMEEIEPHIISRTTNLNEVLPAPDWNWSDEQ